MFLGRMVVFTGLLCLSLASVYGAIEIAMFRHRVLAGWPEVEGRVVAREYHQARKGERSYFIALRFQTTEGALVTSRWTEVRIFLPSWSDPDRGERPPRYLPGETAMLRYDPSDPARVRVSAEISPIAPTMLMAGLGTVLGLGSAWLIRWTMREKTRASLAANTS